MNAGSLGSEDQTDSSDSENTEMLPTAENDSTSRQERGDGITFPRTRINAESQSDNDKPYALMNGFVKRLDSLGRNTRPFRHSSKRTNSTCEESSYVESSPLNSAHYIDPNDYVSTVAELGTAPPPPSSPPPVPPVGHAS